MANKKDNNVEINKILNPSVKLNILFNDLLDKISLNTYGSNNKRTRELEKLNKEIDRVINNEIESLSSFTGDDISIFLSKLFNKIDNTNLSTQKSIEEILSDDSSGLYDFFQERYKNENLLIDDLNVICSNLYELNEAVMATRDAIVTSDDISKSISRSIKFTNTNKDNDESFTKMIENIEKKFRLNDKIKNHIIPNTLQYGKYYVYTVPYSKLLQNYSKKMSNSITMESLIDDDFVQGLRDVVKHDDKTSLPISNKVLCETIKKLTDNIEVCLDDVPVSILEEVEEGAILESSGIPISIFGDESFNKLLKNSSKGRNKNATPFADGTKSLNQKGEDFSHIKGCYIKLLDPTKIKPVKVLDQTIGYLYIYAKELPVERTPLTSRLNLLQLSLSENKSIENNFISKIADKIIKSFNRKFLEENIKFKELIINALLFNDIYKKKIRFQFIPIDYITEFKVNTNEDGEGRSVLLPSLFYAKLYLALLMFKMISIITKSNDTKVYYVKSSGLDSDVVNKVQEIVRSIKSRQINFLELMNYNTMISKIGQNREIFMPVGQSGDKSVEFDILAGQDIQLNTEFMEMLRTAFINATGVPSVIMNYINEADYSRTLVMANTKFIGRVINHQIDFNECITEMYKKILRYTTELEEEIIDSFVYTLATPRYLNNINMNDLIANITNIVESMIKAYVGDSGEDSSGKVRDLLYRDLFREMAPILPWDKLDEIYNKVKMENEYDKTKKNNSERGSDY